MAKNTDRAVSMFEHIAGASGAMVQRIRQILSHRQAKR